jgi:predicted trehalose synthase
MNEYKAVFEIDSKTDAYAVERLMNRMYNSLREESRTLRDGSNDSTEMLEQFEAIRDATRRPTRGRVTVIYESRDEEFEG